MGDLTASNILRQICNQSVTCTPNPEKKRGKKKKKKKKKQQQQHNITVLSQYYKVTLLKTSRKKPKSLRSEEKIMASSNNKRKRSLPRRMPAIYSKIDWENGEAAEREFWDFTEQNQIKFTDEPTQRKRKVSVKEFGDEFEVYGLKESMDTLPNPEKEQKQSHHAPDKSCYLCADTPFLSYEESDNLTNAQNEELRNPVATEDTVDDLSCNETNENKSYMEIDIIDSEIDNENNSGSAQPHELISSDPNKRNWLSAKQYKALHEIFRKNNNPTKTDLERLALKLGVAKAKLSKWFQNQRHRKAKQSESKASAMSPSKEILNTKNSEQTTPSHHQEDASDSKEENQTDNILKSTSDQEDIPDELQNSEAVSNVNSNEVRQCHAIDRGSPRELSPRTKEFLRLNLDIALSSVFFPVASRCYTVDCGNRKEFSPEGKQFLKSYFDLDRQPSQPEKQILAEKLNEKFEKVDRWFTNERKRKHDKQEYKERVLADPTIVSNSEVKRKKRNLLQQPIN